MSDEMKDGGPAFPCRREYQHGGGTGTEHIDGMSLRDHFAGMALNGLIANGKIPSDKMNVCLVCYDYADAMLKARKQ